MQRKILIPVISAFLVLSAPGFATARDDAPAEGEKSAAAEPGEEVLITLEAPLMSPLFSGTPVAVVDDEPITFFDLTRRIASIHKGMAEKGPTSNRRDYADLLNRVVTTRLIVQEARNIGLDELPEVVKNIETVSTELLISRLMSRILDEVEPDPGEVNELYEKMSRELLLTNAKFANEADALSFKEQLDSGEDFGEVAKRFAEEGRAELEASDGQYTKLKDLRTRIAQAAFDMEADSVSEIFTDSGGFLLFRVEAVRSYEDPALKEEARQKVLEPAKKKAAIEYAKVLEEKHCTVDERLLKRADFETKKTGFLSLGEEEPADFKELLKDERVVATVHVDPRFVVTVGDLAGAVQEAFHHGIETAMERKESLNTEKRVVLKNMLFKRTAVAEARILGLDRADDFVDTMDEFETSQLFDVFVKKVVAPDVKISEDEVREYFEEHIGEYSTPTMLRFNAIAFHELLEAERALARLRKRADFKWVSANSPGRVERSNEEIFDFDGALLSLTALPEGLQERVEDARRGDAVVYSDDKGYHYVLVIERVFPSRPQPYESARGEVAKLIFEQKIGLLIDDWSEKLKEAYETRIFVKGLGD
jgi:hypothetical protein